MPVTWAVANGAQLKWNGIQPTPPLTWGQTEANRDQKQGAPLRRNHNNLSEWRCPMMQCKFMTFLVWLPSQGGNYLAHLINVTFTSLNVRSPLFEER